MPWEARPAYFRREQNISGYDWDGFLSIMFDVIDRYHTDIHQNDWRIISGEVFNQGKYIRDSIWVSDTVLASLLSDLLLAFCPDATEYSRTHWIDLGNNLQEQSVTGQGNALQEFLNDRTKIRNISEVRELKSANKNQVSIDSETIQPENKRKAKSSAAGHLNDITYEGAALFCRYLHTATGDRYWMPSENKNELAKVFKLNLPNKLRDRFSELSGRDPRTRGTVEFLKNEYGRLKKIAEMLVDDTLQLGEEISRKTWLAVDSDLKEVKSNMRKAK